MSFESRRPDPININADWFAGKSRPFWAVVAVQFLAASLIAVAPWVFVAEVVK